MDDGALRNLWTKNQSLIESAPSMLAMLKAISIHLEGLNGTLKDDVLKKILEGTNDVINRAEGNGK